MDPHELDDSSSEFRRRRRMAGNFSVASNLFEDDEIESLDVDIGEEVDSIADAIEDDDFFDVSDNVQDQERIQTETITYSKQTRSQRRSMFISVDQINTLNQGITSFSNLF